MAHLVTHIAERTIATEFLQITTVQIQEAALLEIPIIEVRRDTVEPTLLVQEEPLVSTRTDRIEPVEALEPHLLTIVLLETEAPIAEAQEAHRVTEVPLHAQVLTEVALPILGVLTEALVEVLVQEEAIALVEVLQVLDHTVLQAVAVRDGVIALAEALAVHLVHQAEPHVLALQEVEDNPNLQL